MVTKKEELKKADKILGEAQKSFSRGKISEAELRRAYHEYRMTLHKKKLTKLIAEQYMRAHGQLEEWM